MKKKHLSEFYPQDGGESQLALKLRQCHTMYRLRRPKLTPVSLISMATSRRYCCQLLLSPPPLLLLPLLW